MPVQQPVQFVPVPMPSDNKQPTLIDESTLIKPEKEELTRWQLETIDLLGDLEHNLRGDVFIDGRWIKPDKPIMNEEGVRFFISFIPFTISKMTSLTSLSQNQINGNLREIMRDLSDVLSAKHKQFGIDREYMESVMNNILRICEVSMTRSHDGFTVKSLGERVRTVEKVGYDQGKEEQKSGWLPSIFKRK